MKHRLFIALPIHLEAKEKIVLWQKSHTDLPVRWIAPRNLHITLIPPWYTEDIPEVHKKLLTFPKICSLTLWFYKITVGPNNHSPRLIWIEGKRNNQLNVLKHQLEMILDQKPEKRDFLLTSP